MSTFLSNASASTSIASSDSVWVSVAISPSSISFLITSGGGQLQRLGDLFDGRAGADLTAGPPRPRPPAWPAPPPRDPARPTGAGAGGRVRARRLLRGGGGRSRREAWESITTRRRRPPPPPPALRPRYAATPRAGRRRRGRPDRRLTGRVRRAGRRRSRPLGARVRRPERGPRSSGAEPAGAPAAAVRPEGCAGRAPPGRRGAPARPRAADLWSRGRRAARAAGLAVVGGLVVGRLLVGGRVLGGGGLGLLGLLRLLLRGGGVSAGAVAPAPLPNARAASASSTLEAATFTSRPALRRISSASLLVMPRLFRYLVDALLCHSRTKSMVSCLTVHRRPEGTRERSARGQAIGALRVGRTHRRPAPPPWRRGPGGPRRPLRAPVAAARPWAASGGS